MAKSTPKDYGEDQDQNFESCTEIITAFIKAGIFLYGIYMLKEIFITISDLVGIVEEQTPDIILIELIPVGILAICALIIFLIIKKT